MPDAASLAAFLENKTAREWSTIYVTRGPLTDENLIDELPIKARDAAVPWAEVAEGFVTVARADAEAFRSPGPYFVWIGRLDAQGHLAKPRERFPLVFHDVQRTASEETNRQIVQLHQALNESHDRVIHAAEIHSARYDNEVLRAREDLARERAHAQGMAQLVYAGARDTQANAAQLAEALMQGDERRRAKLDEEKQRQVWTAMIGHLDVILPAIASGWLRSKGRDDGSQEAVAEYKLIEAFVQSVRQEQFVAIGAKLPPHVRMGLMDIYNGKIAAVIVPAMAAKLFAQIDDKLSFEIYLLLDKEKKREGLHEGRAAGDECKVCGQPPGLHCVDPSEQQKLWSALMQTRRNTLAARGEQALAAVGAAGVMGA